MTRRRWWRAYVRRWDRRRAVVATRVGVTRSWFQVSRKQNGSNASGKTTRRTSQVAAFTQYVLRFLDKVSRSHFGFYSRFVRWVLGAGAQPPPPNPTSQTIK